MELGLTLESGGLCRGRKGVPVARWHYSPGGPFSGGSGGKANNPQCALPYHLSTFIRRSITLLPLILLLKVK